MQPFRIRPACPGDVEVLLRFQQGIVSAERPFDPTLREGPVGYYDIPRLLAAENVRVALAESGAEAVGCGFARIEASKPYLKHAEQAYLGLMYVDPRHRGRGINGQIIEHLMAWCRQRGVAELRLEVYPGNLAAVSSYRRSGFVPHMLEMRMALKE